MAGTWAHRPPTEGTEGVSVCVCGIGGGGYCSRFVYSPGRRRGSCALFLLSSWTSRGIVSTREWSVGGEGYILNQGYG